MKKIVSNYSSFIWDGRGTSIAQMIVATPIFSFYETQIVGMDNLESFTARVVGSSMIFFGLGPLYEKYRNFVQKKLIISKMPTESEIKKADRFSNSTFNFSRGLLTYSLAGVDSGKEFFLGTAGMVAYGFTIGPKSGYLIDLINSKYDIKKNNRKIISKNSNRKNNTIIAAIFTASALATTINYSVDLEISKNVSELYNQSNLEKIIQSFQFLN
jgi:hypothetical protein